MRCSVFLLALALLGCTKKTVEHPTQSHSFAAQDVCAQGPFSVSVGVPTSKNPHLLRLGFALETIPSKLFYQVKITASGKVLATGALEQKVETAPNQRPPKNPCLGRTMPLLTPAPTTPTPATPTANAEGGYVLVIIPDARAPQMMWLNYQALTAKSPSIDVPLENIPAASQLEVLFWSEEPYPLGKARIQASLIELKKEFVPDPERVQARKERKEKRLQQQLAQAILWETERLKAAQDRDAALALLGKEDPSQKDFFEAERGRFLRKFSKQWERAVYGNKYDKQLRSPLEAALSEKVLTFIRSRQAQLYAYDSWRDRRRQSSKDLRKERRKDAVARYTKLEALHLGRLERRDKRLVKRQEQLKADSQAFKDLDIKRGKKLKHYDRHLRAFSWLTKLRTFGDSRPEAYHKLKSKADAFLSARSSQRSAYESWKNNKQDAREEKRDKAKREREKKRDQREDARYAKKVERSTKLVATWRERLESLISDDDAAAKRGQALKGDDKKQQDFTRGKDISNFRKRFLRDMEKYSRFGESYQLWSALLSEVQRFVDQRAEQTYAYETWKDEQRRVKKNAREDRRDQREAKRDQRGAKRSREKLARESERAKKLAASWKERLASLKASDEAAAKKSLTLKGDAQLAAEAKRGEEILAFQKRFLKKYHKFSYKDAARGLWASLYEEVNSFLVAHEAQLNARYAHEEKLRAEKQNRETKARKARMDRAVQREAARFARLEKKDAAYAAALDKTPAEDTKARDSIVRAWGKELTSYKKHFDGFVEKSYKERFIRTDSFNKLFNEVNALYALRQSTINSSYVLKTPEPKRKKTPAERQRERREAKGGTHRALKRWEQAILDEKALLKQIEAQPEGSREKLQKQRRSLLEKEIAALFKVYNKATPEGQQYLSKAFQQATALQFDISEKIAGPTPPPLPLPETPGPQPMAGAVWHAGYWKLENDKWTWKPGFWELPPGAVP